MPERVRITPETFERIKKWIIDHGGRILGDKEKKKTYESIGLVPPERKVRNYGEVGGIFFINGLIIFVWTSFVMKTMEDNWQDHGWVLIISRDQKKFFAQPKNRTANFEQNLIRELEIALARAHARPNCSICKRRMSIYKKYNKNKEGGVVSISTMWACFNKEKHARPTFEDWDTGLSEKQKKFVNSRRKFRKKKRDSDKEKGVTRTPAAKKRKKWTITRPDNLD